MFKSFCVISLILPIIAETKSLNSKEDNHVVETESTVCFSNPTSSMVIKKHVEYLKKEIGAMKNISAKKAYDYFSKQKKEISDKNLLEIYYVMISFLRVQPNITPGEKLQAKLESLLNHLDWLYSDHANEKFSDKVTHLGNLINPDIFIHLNHKKMSECLNNALQLKDIVEYSSLGNDLTPEDGPDWFNPDFFLQKEINSAQQIYSQVTAMEKLALDFSKYCETLSKEQLTANIINANHLINKLKFVSISVEKRNIRISRNTRKHLKNLIFSSIEKLIQKRNQLN